MKQNWEYCQLEDAVTKGSSNISLNKIKDEDGDYPVFAAKGFVQNVSFFQQEKRYLAIIKDGAGIGRVSKHPAKSSVVATMQYLIPKKDFDIDFIKYFLEGIDFEKHRNGSTIPHIYFKDYKSESFPNVLLPEQQRIVSILDKCFSAIERSRNNAEQNLKNAKELFESYSEFAFNNNSQDWKDKTLGDVCSLYQGIAINAKTRHAIVEKSDLPLLRIKDLRNNTVEQFIDPNNYPKNALVTEEDIIYTRTGNSLGLVFRGRRGVLHNNSFKIVPTDELSRDYLFNWLQNPKFKSKIFGLAFKAAQPDITHAIFKIQEIKIPTLKEQQNIVQNIDAMRAETQKMKAIYQKKIADMEELKKSILQKAFAGELPSGEPAEPKTEKELV
jgi:type I restriction enzyme S subunit